MFCQALFCFPQTVIFKPCDETSAVIFCFCPVCKEKRRRRFDAVFPLPAITHSDAVKFITGVYIAQIGYFHFVVNHFANASAIRPANEAAAAREIVKRRSRPLTRSFSARTSSDNG